MTDRILDYDFPAPWPYEGTVIARDDGGWVKVRIDGEMDESPWFPVMAMPASGGSDHGAAIVPPVGATVVIFFIGGDREAGRVVGAHYGDGEIPTGTVISDGGDKVIWRDGRVQIEVDGRGGSTGVRILDQAAAGAGVLLAIDIAGRQVGLSSALGVTISTTGVLALQGGSVTIQGRPVAPAGPPL